MMNFLHTFWAVPVAFYVLWVSFLATANVEYSVAAKDVKLHVALTALPLVAVMITVDVLLNVLVMSLVLFELPREWTVSERLRRCIDLPKGSWRHGVARFVEAYVDPFDHLRDHI